jgi:hypothetical protein
MRRGTVILGLAVALAWIAAPADLWGAEPPSRPPPNDGLIHSPVADREDNDNDQYRPPKSALGLIRDMRLTIQAQRLLKADRGLAPLKLKVEVRNGVAQLSGTVPSDGVGREAVGKLETIKGIEEVRSNFQYRPAPLNPAATGTHVEVAKPPEIDPLKTRPGEPAVVTGSEGHKGRTDPPASPIPVKPRVAPASTVAIHPPSLAEQVARIRQMEARFQTISVDVQDSMLIVHRAGVSSADATALAEKLRRIPGVGEVLISSD